MVDVFSIDNDLLISLVEQNPVLWDITAELYKNRAATQEAWNEIVLVFDPNFETKEEKAKQAFVKLLIKRWTHIRDNYSRSCNKIRDQKRSGGSVKTTKPYIYSKQLSFLQKVIQPKEAISNVITEIKNIESENCNSEASVTSEENSIQIDDKMETINLTPNRIAKRSMKNDVSPINKKMIKFMDSFSNNESTTMNRHLSFFNGILPSLDKFDEDEVLDFQIGVLQLLKKITNSRQNRESPINSQRIFYSDIQK